MAVPAEAELQESVLSDIDMSVFNPEVSIPPPSLCVLLSDTTLSARTSSMPPAPAAVLR